MDQREFAGQQQMRQKKRRMMKHAHLLRARQSIIWNGKIQKTWHGMLPGLQLFPEDWWLTSSHDALWSVWVPAGYNLRADQSYKKSHILPSYTVYTVCTQCAALLFTGSFSAERSTSELWEVGGPWECCQGRWLRCSSCLGHDVVGRPG